ncbi:MAG TPA: BrnT family toxin [Thermoanaerobaculia bacterium]|nr:BrnT family toxin [Thermoanaerobaculia bacterium]
MSTEHWRQRVRQRQVARIDDNMGFNPYLPMATVVDGDFEWDSAKAEANLAKHGVSFPEAATVFADPFAVYIENESSEDRMVVIGTSLRERVLFVVHVERDERDRIVSARRATAGEREVYEARGPS